MNVVKMNRKALVNEINEALAMANAALKEALAEAHVELNRRAHMVTTLVLAHGGITNVSKEQMKAAQGYEIKVGPSDLAPDTIRVEAVPRPKPPAEPAPEKAN